MLLRILLLVVIALACSPLLAANAPAILKALRPAHPRLFLLDADWTAAVRAVGQDALAKKWAERLRGEAVKMPDEKPIVHELIGPRLLDKSRTALRRVSTLAAMYRLTGDKRFADRAKLEMLTAAAFKDWNPSHFLHTAEMSTALGIGYDWLFDSLTPAERKTIREGLVKLGLRAGLEGFEKTPAAWWTKARHNWGQVCMGGLTVGALAIADEEPELCGKLLEHTTKAIVPSMNAFAPDGGCPEGPGYWGYATRYHVFFLAACESALGPTFERERAYKKIPGVADMGH